MGLSVIGAGFGRTGTESMKSALEILGFGPCLHMKVILADPALEAYWRTVIKDEQQGKAPNWDEVYQDWHSAVDFPTACYWRELSAHYPDAKVILTVRDAESWYESVSNTIMKILDRITDPDSIGLRLISQGVFHGRLDDRDYAIGLYEKHNAEVRAGISADRLLEYNLGDGWDPLCRLLGRGTPNEPYPSGNDSDDFHAFFEKRLEQKD